MGKKGQGGKEARGASSRPSSWSFWIWTAGIVLVIAWSSLRNEVLGKTSRKSPVKDVADTDEEEEAEDERLDAVRDALFGDEKQSILNVGKAGADGSKQGTRFASAEYWDKRYTKTRKETYDWYGTWNSESAIRIKPKILAFLPTQVQSVLNIGCGNSIFAEELANDGYRDIVSIDISQAAIDRMLQKFAGRNQMSFLQMDATQMKFKEGTFDLVFDKGTLDAMYTGAAELVAQTVQEVYRVLKPGGLFVSLTFGAPSSRKDLNRTNAEKDAPPGWKYFKTLRLDEVMGIKGQMFYIYLMSKPA